MCYKFEYKAWHKSKKIMFDIIGFDFKHVYPVTTNIFILPPPRGEVILLKYLPLKDINDKYLCEGDYILIECSLIQKKKICLITFNGLGFMLKDIQNNKMVYIGDLNIKPLTISILGNEFQNNKTKIWRRIYGNS